MKTIIVIGGTGAQGTAVVQYLASTNQYKILTLTRSTSSPQAQNLAKLPNVELIESNSASTYDADAYLAAAQRADYAFINTDGFALGEQAETYWGIRFFELSVRAGIKHFIWSGLDANGKKSGYDPKFYVGHYEGKARVQAFIRAQETSPMSWTTINSGPYFEMLSEVLLPQKTEDGTFQFQLPIGNGAVPFIHLGDFGRYVAWALENPAQSNGTILQIASAHVSGPELASAFQNVTGHPTSYVDIPAELWTEVAFGHLPNGTSTKVGSTTVKDDNALNQTFGENFVNWWNLYKASADNQGLIQRDYALLDRILPDRVKGVEEWMRLVKYDGTKQAIIKGANDGSR